MKLREISVSATRCRAASRSRSSRTLTQDIRVELSGRNLKTWTPYTGYDPRGVQLLQPGHRAVPGRDAVSAEPQPVRLDFRQLLTTVHHG